MLTLPACVRIYVAARPVDLRKGFYKLASIARTIVDGDPMSGHVFVFLNRRKNLGNDVIAMLLLRKYAEHTTLYRLHHQFLREQGVEIPRSTLGDWIAWGGLALQRLSEPMLEHVKAQFLVGIDATGLRVLDSGPDRVHRGTFHQYRGASGAHLSAQHVDRGDPTVEALLRKHGRPRFTRWSCGSKNSG